MLMDRRRRQSKLRFGFAAAVIAFVLGTVCAVAQVLYGTMVGNVTDATGAAIPGASVTIVNLAQGATRTATTNGQGEFDVVDLPAGTYQVRVQAQGFATVVQNNVVLENNSTRRVNASLSPAQVAQTVTVNSEALALQTDRSDVDTELTAQQVENLPSSPLRNFQSLFRTVPGTTPPATSHAGASNPQFSLAFTVNGGTQTQNNTRIDGASDVYPWLPEIAAYVPPEDAIQAVNIVTNSFDAEQGMGGSSVINVTLKSGTNQLHGAAWEYNTLSNLQARNWFYPAGSRIPKYILNQFGADLGGPIVRGKLFFFGDWERTAQRDLIYNYATVPTAAEIAGNFNGTGTTIYDPTLHTPLANDTVPAITPAAAKMLSMLPAPNVAGATANNYFATGDYALTRDNADIKVSYLPGGRTTLFTSYSISPSTIFDPQELGGAGGPAIDGGQPGNSPGRIQRAVVGGTYAFTPSLLLDGNFGFTRIHFSSENTDINSDYGSSVLGIPGTNTGAPPGSNLDGGIPYFELSGFTSLGNTNSSNPFVFRDNLWVEQANLTWNRGNHSIRTGAEIFHVQVADFQANPTFGVRGGFNFTGGITTKPSGSSTMYNSLADFEYGLPYSMGEDHQFLDPALIRENTLGFYVRDQWQASHNLTLTYGLRYELYPYSSSDNGIGGLRYDPTTNLMYFGGINGVPHNAGVSTGYGIVVPRLGAAYRINDKTVIRGGFGMNPSSEFFRDNVQAYPNVISAQYSGATSQSPAGSLTTGIPTFVGPNISAGTLTLPSNVGTYTYPKNYRRGYAENANVFVQRDLGGNILWSVGYVHSHGIRVPAEFNINAGTPGGGKASQPLYVLYGNASTINLDNPFLSSDYNALQTVVQRHIGRRGTIGANYTYSKAMDSADSAGESTLLFNSVGYVGKNYSLAGFDRKHNFEAYTNYDLPIGHDEPFLNHGVAAAIVGGWQMNAILSRMSGAPFSVTASSTSLNDPGNSQLANQVQPHIRILGGHGPNSPYFDPNAFAPVTTATFGTSSRDEVRGPGFFDLDASLFRDFYITERLKLQFRAEAFGLTNTPQFGNPGANVSNATFTNGVVTNYNGYDIITSSTGQRQFRFAAKLSF